MLQPQFSPFPVLETSRLLLRRVTEADAGEIFYFRSDPAILQYLGREPAKTMEEIQKFMAAIDNNINTNESILWGIALKEEPAKLIGTICFWQLQPQNFRAEIGYLLDPKHWGKGMMKEAVLQVLDYGFNILQLHSVEARLTAGNLASAGVLKATGFLQEGLFREDCYFNGKFEDTAVYSRRKNE